MSEISRIADQLHRGFYGEAWHGPAVLELLQGVTAAQAVARPVGSAHSIWEIVQHVSAWKRAIPIRLRGGEIELTGDQDWPPVTDASPDAWDRTLHELKVAHAELEAAVRLLPVSRLGERVPSRDHDVYFLLHGMVQHDLYHAGQIAVLKKG
jgi:uncharacterized damage-inducible protein DinB